MRFTTIKSAVLMPLVVLSWVLPPALTARADDQQQQPPRTEVPRVRLERFIPKLDKPVDVVTDPAGRLFFVEQSGRVWQHENGQLAKAPYLDLSKKVYVEYECGLLSVAFHPKFAENGYVYASYTAKAPNIKSFVVEFRADPAAPRVDLKTERVVLTLDQPYPNHNGGQIRFGPDGFLYVGFGDGGSMHDPHGNGQNPRTMLGKIVRLDVTPREGYAVPKDNPFVGDGAFLPEIWALGLRNPWRFEFDRQTGLLYAADVGQDLWEEVHLIERGGNYGWRVREGSHDLHPESRGTVPAGASKLIDPIFEYSHERTAASVTGGCVYRGKAIPALVGWYLFGDYSTGRIYGLKYEGGKVVASGVLIDPTDTTRANRSRATQPACFGVDAHGEMFLCDVNGPVYRIVPDR